jgi:hypothetical protein
VVQLFVVPQDPIKGAVRTQINILISQRRRDLGWRQMRIFWGIDDRQNGLHFGLVQGVLWRLYARAAAINVILAPALQTAQRNAHNRAGFEAPSACRYSFINPKT